MPNGQCTVSDMFCLFFGDSATEDNADNLLTLTDWTKFPPSSLVKLNYFSSVLGGWCLMCSRKQFLLKVYWPSHFRMISESGSKKINH